MPGESHPSLLRFGGDRLLAAALLISLAVHALALLPAYGPSAADGGAPIRATLLDPHAAPAATPSADETIAPPKRAPLPEPVERTYEKASAAASAPENPGESAPNAARPASPPNAAGAPSNEGAALPQLPRPAIDLAGLRQYHAALSRVAERFRRYPPQAREAGWEGQVAMRLSISEAGTLAGLELIGSSGYPLLDRAALEMMNLAANHTPVPDSLRGRAFSIDLAATYNLRDEP